MFHVKHLDQNDVAYARQLLDSARITVEPDQLAVLLRHLDWVLDVNRAIRLTAVSDPKRALAVHVVDSLIALDALSSAPQGGLVDIGSGAGYPGLPLAIVTGRRTVLLEPIRKKAEALRRFLVQENLEPWISVVEQRAEEYARAAPARTSVVTARAVASLPALVELAAPLLSPGGWLIAFKGSPDESEVAWGDRAAAICGLARRDVQRLTLPGEGHARTLIVYERCTEPLVDLPRRVGAAQKRPLGKA